MILELASQSIQTKLRLKSTTLMGNYEFYYAAGRLCREIQLTVDEEIKPKELHDYMETHTAGKEYENPTAAHLVKMIHFYIPEEHYDIQMKELLQRGMEGKI